MKTADQICSNGTLSISELRFYLQSTRYRT